MADHVNLGPKRRKRLLEAKVRQNAMFEVITEGAGSYRDIAKKLAEKGHVNPTTGKQWSHEMIRSDYCQIMEKLDKTTLGTVAWWRNICQIRLEKLYDEARQVNAVLMGRFMDSNGKGGALPLDNSLTQCRNIVALQARVSGVFESNKVSNSDALVDDVTEAFVSLLSVSGVDQETLDKIMGGIKTAMLQ